MVKLRSVGVPVAQSQEMAEQVAASVVFIALANHPSSLMIEAEKGRAERYRDALERDSGEGYLASIADVPPGNVVRFGVLHDGAWKLAASLEEETVDDTMEASALINFGATAAAIVAAAPRPLFTLVVPSSFN